MRIFPHTGRREVSNIVLTCKDFARQFFAFRASELVELTKILRQTNGLKEQDLLTLDTALQDLQALFRNRDNQEISILIPLQTIKQITAQLLPKILCPEESDFALIEAAMTPASFERSLVLIDVSAQSQEIKQELASYCLDCAEMGQFELATLLSRLLIGDTGAGELLKEISYCLSDEELLNKVDLRTRDAAPFFEPLYRLGFKLQGEDRKDVLQIIAKNWLKTAYLLGNIERPVELLVQSTDRGNADEIFYQVARELFTLADDQEGAEHIASFIQEEGLRSQIFEGRDDTTSWHYVGDSDSSSDLDISPNTHHSYQYDFSDDSSFDIL